MTRRALVLLALVVAALPACRGGAAGRGRGAAVADRDPGIAAASAATSPLRVDGTSVLSLGEAPAAEAAARLVADVEAALAGGRRAHAVADVRLRPEAALAALVRAPADPSPALRLVATVHDAQCGRGGEPGWLAALAGEGAGRRGDAASLRREAMARLEAGDARGAAERAARAAAAPGPLPLRVDAWRLAGVALALDARAAEAAAAFRQGADLARTSRPYEAATLGLLEADARRRAGDPTGAASAWAGAVAAGAALAAADPDLPDPSFLERAATTRPADAAWPAAAAASLGAAGRRAFGAVAASAVPTGSDPSLVWALAARGHLARDDARAALLAASRAETAATAPGWRDRVRVESARALARLGEPPRAFGILGAVADRGDPAGAPAALAVWGAFELEAGRVARARALLARGLEGLTDGGELAASTEANLGLALLAEGRAAEGLARLRAAEARLQREGRVLEWMQSLENELVHAESARDVARADELRGRLTAAHAGAF